MSTVVRQLVPGFVRLEAQNLGVRREIERLPQVARWHFRGFCARNLDPRLVHYVVPLRVQRAPEKRAQKFEHRQQPLGLRLDPRVAGRTLGLR